MSLLVHVAQLSLYHNPFSSRQREYSVCNVAEASNCPPPSHHQRCHVSPQGTTTQWLPGSIEARGGAGLPNASVNLILPRPPPLWGWLGVCVRFPKQQLYMLRMRVQRLKWHCCLSEPPSSLLTGCVGYPADLSLTCHRWASQTIFIEFLFCSPMWQDLSTT